MIYLPRTWRKKKDSLQDDGHDSASRLQSKYERNGRSENYQDLTRELKLQNMTVKWSTLKIFQTLVAIMDSRKGCGSPNSSRIRSGKNIKKGTRDLTYFESLSLTS